MRTHHIPSTEYAARQANITVLLAELLDAKRAHAARAAAAPASWGFPADLGRLECVLREAICAVGGDPFPAGSTQAP